ncbi:MAG: 50S ribosomal protein L10 [Actinomycetes bacterium]
MASSDKVTAVAEIADKFRSASATVLTEYRGLSVAQLKELRRSLGEGTSYTVVKNTLAKIAAKEAGIEGFDDLLVGPSALTFVEGDVVTAAKGLKEFAKTNPALVIKGGYMDGKPLTVAEISKLADLESREVLLAKLAGAMSGSLQQAVSLFAAPLSKTARTVDALRAKVEAEGPPAAEASAEPDTEASAAPDTEAPAAPVAEASVSPDTDASDS